MLSKVLRKILFGLHFIFASAIFFSPSLPHALAQSTDWEIKIIPFKLGANFGYGYDSRSKSLVLTAGSCMEVDPSQTYQAGESAGTTDWDKVSTRSDIVRLFNISPKVSLDLLKIGSLSASGDFLKGNEINQYNISYLAHTYSYEVPKFLELNVLKLKQKYVDMLRSGKTGQFRNECGDSFIWGFQQGREYQGVLTVDTRDQKKWRDWSGNAGIGVDLGIVDVSLSVGQAKKIDQHFGLDSLTIFQHQTDTGRLNVTSAEQFVSEYENFDIESGKFIEIGMVPAPYSIAENYPTTGNILDPYLEDSGLLAYVNLLWDYKAVIDDARFTLENPSFFALGSKESTRNARLREIVNQKKKWEARFQEIQQEARLCLDDPEKAEAELHINCETGAQRFENPLPQRSIALPQRYESVCQDLTLPSRDITQGGLSRINVHNLVRGDAQMGEGPVRVITNLRVAPEGTQLLANIDIKLLEWKINSSGDRRTNGNRDTEFTGEATIPIFDMNNPEKFGVNGLFVGNLQDCVFPGTGIREGHEKGAVDVTSERNPENFKKFTGKGLIRSIECELSRRGSEKNALSCKNLEINGTTVRLMNRADYLIDGILEDIEKFQAMIDKGQKAMAGCSAKIFKFLVEACERGYKVAIKRLEEDLKVHQDEFNRNLTRMQPQASNLFARFKGWPSSPGGFGSSVLFARSAQGDPEIRRFREPQTSKSDSLGITLPEDVRKELNRRLVKAGSKYIIMKPKRKVFLDSREQLQNLEKTIQDSTQ